MYVCNCIIEKDMNINNFKLIQTCRPSAQVTSKVRSMSAAVEAFYDSEDDVDFDLRDLVVQKGQSLFKSWSASTIGFGTSEVESDTSTELDSEDSLPSFEIPSRISERNSTAGQAENKRCSSPIFLFTHCKRSSNKRVSKVGRQAKRSNKLKQQLFLQARKKKAW